MHRMRGAVKLRSAPFFRTAEALLPSLYEQIPLSLHIYTLLFVSILSRSHLHAKSVFRPFGEVVNILVLKS